MGLRTNYTKTYTVPIKARWICSCCKQINESTGDFEVEYTGTAYNVYSNSKMINKVDNKAEDWADYLLNVIEQPYYYPNDYRDGLLLQNNKCVKCGKKEKWSHKRWWYNYAIFAFFAAIFSFFIAISEPKSILAWSVLFVLSGFVLYCIFDEKNYSKRYLSIPEESRPQIISANKELIDTARKRGIVIDRFKEVDENLQTNSFTNMRIAYCRKCGAKLVSDALFCNKCGYRLDNTCSHCGKVIPDESKFCPFCGLKKK